MLQVECEAALVTVQSQPVRFLIVGLSSVNIVFHADQPAPAVHPVPPLDLDHVGSPVGQQHGEAGASQPVREIEDSDAFQWQQQSCFAEEG